MKKRAIFAVWAGAAMGVLFAQSASVKQPKIKSQKEQEAIMAIFNATDPDARIAAAESLLAKFADTEFKAVALQVAAASAQQKNDFEKMVVYCDRTLEVDPKNYSAMLMLATGYAQRTREFDLDKEEKLGKAEKLAREALELVKTALKPRPDIADEQWEAARKDFISQGHEALGLAASVRKKTDVVIAEFKLAIETAANVDPATMVRLGAAYNTAARYDEAIAVLDKALLNADLHPQIKQFAQNEKSRAMQGKAGAAKPAAAPPAEAKKQ